MHYYCDLRLEHPDLGETQGKDILDIIFKIPDMSAGDPFHASIAAALRYVRERLDRYQEAKVIRIAVGVFIIGVVAPNGHVTTNRFMPFFVWTRDDPNGQFSPHCIKPLEQLFAEFNS